MFMLPKSSLPNLGDLFILGYIITISKVEIFDVLLTIKILRRRCCVGGRGRCSGGTGTHVQLGEPTRPVNPLAAK